MSLRAKLTLALLLMGFAAIAAVGITARTMTLNRFDEFVVDRAVEGFIEDATAYYRAYGSWEAARDSGETFIDFIMRTRGGPGRGGRGAPPSPPGGRGRAGGPGEPPGGRGLGGPPPPFPLGAELPPFAVTNRAGEVLMPNANAQVGDIIPAGRMADARPIVDGTEEIGMAVALERPVLTALEQRYLTSMRNAWLSSMLVATVLAIPLGLLFGYRLTRPIQDITRAMGEMKAGQLRQAVAVRSRDEVGRLAQSFNEMSSRLSTAHEEAEASRVRLDGLVQEMAELSRHDPLTGLMNRRGFDERAGLLLAHAARYMHDVCVAMLDVDRFKPINDEFSHAVGDQVLVRGARILRDELRESDVVARYGGEEFVVAFPETSLASAEILAERLRRSFEAAGWDDLLSGRIVTVSIGVAQVHGRDGLADALERADEQLYRAKRGGRNRVEAQPA